MHKKMIPESLGNFRISDVRLVRLMSKWENPTFVSAKIYTILHKTNFLIYFFKELSLLVIFINQNPFFILNF